MDRRPTKRQSKETGASHSITSTTWEAVAERFIIDRRAQNLSPATLDLYRQVLVGKRTLAWLHGHGVHDVADFTRATLADLQVAFADGADGLRPMRPTSVHAWHRVIKTFAAWARDAGYATGLELRGVAAPRLPEHRPDVISDAEERQLMAAIRHPRDRMLLDFLINTGLRLHEACTVTVDDINTAPEGYWLHVRQGKGRKDRVVPLDRGRNQLSKRLEDYIRTVRPRETRRRELFLTLRRDSRAEYQPLATSSVEVLFRRLSAETGIHIHAHKCRHTFATRAVAAGVQQLVLQRVLGHTTLQMTSRYYQASTHDLIRAWSDAGRD